MSILFFLFVVTLSYASRLDYCGVSVPNPQDDFSIPPLSDSQSEIVGELIQVHTFIRHGDRTSFSGEKCWPGDNAVWSCGARQVLAPALDGVKIDGLEFVKEYLMDENDRPGNCRVGELTDLGMQQEVINGEHLREAYIERNQLLDATINISQLFLRSDDAQRTLLSAQSLISGMFPNEEQLIPLYTMDLDREDIVANPNICPDLKEINAKVYNSSRMTQFHAEKVDPLMKDIASYLNITQNEMVDFVPFQDCMMTYFCHGFDLPISEELFEQLNSLNNEEFGIKMDYPSPNVYDRFTIGPLLNSVSNVIQAKIAGHKSSRLFYLYSGHDTEPMLPLLHALGIWDGKWTPYASMINWEIYESKLMGGNSHLIRVVYNGKEQHIPWCDQPLCKLDQFLAGLLKVIPTKEECPGLQPF